MVIREGLQNDSASDGQTLTSRVGDVCQGWVRWVSGWLGERKAHQPDKMSAPSRKKTAEQRAFPMKGTRSPLLKRAIEDELKYLLDMASLVSHRGLSSTQQNLKIRLTMPSLIKKLSFHTLTAVHIEPYFQDTPLAAGTAFCVSYKNRMYLVTAKHNLSGRRTDDNRPISKQAALPNCVKMWTHGNDVDDESWVDRVLPIADDEGSPLWYEHHMPAVDIAALPFSPRGSLIPAFLLRQNEKAAEVPPGSPIHLIGYPLGRTSHGHFAIWNTGSLATDMAIDFDGLPCFLVDCTARAGNSGSPVFAGTGHQSRVVAHGKETYIPELALLGIYTGRLDEKSDIGIAWKLSAVLDVLEIADRHNQLPSIDQPK